MQTQARLFQQQEPGLRPLEEGLQRSELGTGSWMDLRRSWLIGDDRLFDELVDTTDWIQGRRQMYDRTVDVPRLTGGLDDPLPPRLAILGKAASTLHEHYRRPVNRLSLALYRDGRDSVAFHGDRMGAGVADCIVAILSLRGPRRFLVRPKASGADRRRSLQLDLGHGDLLVMGGRAQVDFEHSVPKVADAPPRLSVMFRSSTPGGVR